MVVPDYLLSFDPGGSSTTWAYCLSEIKDNQFTPLDVGYVPVLEDIAVPDVLALRNFKTYIMKQLPKSAEVDLCAERWIARSGSAGKAAEYISFSLGAWTLLWGTTGHVRFITASQWKVKLKKEPRKLPKGSKYKEWWEDQFHAFKPIHQLKNKITHPQDACGIGYFYWKYILKLDACYA